MVPLAGAGVSGLLDEIVSPLSLREAFFATKQSPARFAPDLPGKTECCTTAAEAVTSRIAYGGAGGPLYSSMVTWPVWWMPSRLNTFQGVKKRIFISSQKDQ